MGISFEDVIENNLLSEEVIECLPRYCECGALIEFTDTLRQIYCTNSKCYYKIASRLEAMAKHMKVDGWGESTCVEVCKYFKMISPYQVFLLEDYVKKGGTCNVPAFEKKVKAICDMDKRTIELWQVVMYAGIQSIETVAYKIFNGYNSLSEAFEDITKGQVAFIAYKLGIKQIESSVMALNIYNKLIEYKDELLFGETKFKIRKASGDVLHIAITGPVDGYHNKSEYIDFIRDRYDGKVNPMLMGTVTSQVDILIADSDTNSRKYNTALNMNDRYLKKGLSNGEFSYSDVGKFKNEKDLHPIGEKILITDSVNLIQVLDKIYKDL